MAGKPIMPDMAEMAKRANTPDMADVPIMPDVVNMARRTNTFDMASKPIMPDPANMARNANTPGTSIRFSQPSEALQSIKWGNLQQSISPIPQQSFNWVPSTPSWVPSTFNEAVMPTDMDIMPYTERPPLPKPIYNRHDYRRLQQTKRHKQHVLNKIKQTYDTAERGQYRQKRALAWWRAWEHLQAAQHEIDVRTAWQMKTPDIRNSLCLHAA